MRNLVILTPPPSFSEKPSEACLPLAAVICPTCTACPAKYITRYKHGVCGPPYAPLVRHVPPSLPWKYRMVYKLALYGHHVLPCTACAPLVPHVPLTTPSTHKHALYGHHVIHQYRMQRPVGHASTSNVLPSTSGKYKHCPARCTSQVQALYCQLKGGEALPPHLISL